MFVPIASTGDTASPLIRYTFITVWKSTHFIDHITTVMWIGPNNLVLACACSICTNFAYRHTYANILYICVDLKEKGHTGPVWKVVWGHPEYGQILASCSFDRSVIIWEEQSMALFGQFRLGHFPPYVVY